jgi:Helix-turn-helix domain
MTLSEHRVFIYQHERRLLTPIQDASGCGRCRHYDERGESKKGIEMPALLNGRLTNFSSSRLMRLLTALGQDVEIVIVRGRDVPVVASALSKHTRNSIA